MIRGFILVEESGAYLSQHYKWFNVTNIDECYHYVFTKEEAKGIINTSIKNNWLHKPKYIIDAIWTEKNGTKILGEKIDAKEIYNL